MTRKLTKSTPGVFSKIVYIEFLYFVVFEWSIITQCWNMNMLEKEDRYEF